MSAPIVYFDIAGLVEFGSYPGSPGA